MFFGQYQHRLTSGRRLALPSKIRLEIKGDEVVLVKTAKGAIDGFDKSEWEKTGKKYLEIPLYEKKGREIRQDFFGNSQIQEIDQQGRIVLPADFVSWGKIKEKVVIVGAGDHFEIWEESKWKGFLKEENDLSKGKR